MALKDLVIKRWPSEREIDAAATALDAMLADPDANDFTRRVAETALKAAVMERHTMRLEAKKRKRTRNSK